MLALETLLKQTIGQTMLAAAARWGDKEAYLVDGTHLSYRQVEQQSAEVARAFLASGIAKGDRVGVWMAGHAEWMPLYFGLARIGAVLVTLNTRFKPEELLHGITNSDASVLVFKREKTESGKDYGDLLNETLPDLAKGTGDAPLKLAGAPALRTVIDVAGSGMKGTLAWKDFLARASQVSPAQLQAAEAKVSNADDAIISYTSGTTSMPKGALLYHQGILRGAWETNGWLLLGEDDSLFSIQPYYHSGGSVPQMLMPMITGGRILTQAYFNATRALDMMESEKATALIGHQPHFIEYMNHPTFPHRKFAIKHMLVIAGPEIFHMVREKFGVDGLVSGYGMTETHMLGTASSILDDPIEVRFNTNGRPVQGCKVEIRDPEGQVLGPDEEGEIYIRTDFLMRGYLGQPEATAEALIGDNWYRTGDKGLIRKDGNLVLLGRVRDMIRVGGENLSGAEVEVVLLGHPAIKQAAAVAKPDPRMGEVVVAFVELKHDQSATEEELIAYCKSKLAGYKVPREFYFINEWPLSGSGKLQKRLLVIPDRPAKS